MRRSRWLLVVGTVAVCASAAWVLLVPRAADIPAGEFEITAIDVGQGDSFLISTPEGRTILLDSGGQPGSEGSEFDIGEDVVSPYLWSRGLRTLDVVAVSHTHSDHVGGMSAVIRNFRPAELWLSPGAAVRERARLLAAADENHVAVKERGEGERWSFGGAEFEVLWPDTNADFTDKVRDDDAMVLRVSSLGRTMLLTGDIGKKTEQTLAASVGTVDLLKVSHHGSATSTTPEWLQTLHPRIALISAGKRNRFRHPRPEILQRLGAASVSTFRTDMLGAIRVRLQVDTAEIRPSALPTPLRLPLPPPKAGCCGNR